MAFLQILLPIALLHGLSLAIEHLNHLRIRVESIQAPASPAGWRRPHRHREVVVLKQLSDFHDGLAAQHFNARVGQPGEISGERRYYRPRAEKPQASEASPPGPALSPALGSAALEPIPRIAM
jgi:hypothetical protein